MNPYASSFRPMLSSAAAAYTSPLDSLVSLSTLFSEETPLPEPQEPSVSENFISRPLSFFPQLESGSVGHPELFQRDERRANGIPPLPHGYTRPLYPQATQLTHPEQVISILILNLLFPQTAKPGSMTATAIGFTKTGGTTYENSDVRILLSIKNISVANPDVVLLSEVTGLFAAVMTHYLCVKGEYELIWKNHDDNAKHPHGVGILYKRDKFYVRNSSTAPHDYSNDRYPKVRTDLVVDLQDRAGRVHRVVSTHMIDPRHFNWGEKTRHAENVVKLALTPPPEKYTLNTCTIGGDLNQDQFGDYTFPPSRVFNMKSSVFEYFRRHGFIPFEIDPSSSTENTLDPHDQLVPTGRHLSYALTRNGKVEHIPLCKMEPFASDHKPVLAYLTPKGLMAE